MPLDQIPLEDDACDVIAKAMRGLEIEPQLLAQKAGISRDILDSALRGDHADVTLEKIAPILDLSASALVGLADYKPETQLPDGLYRFVTPFGHAGVNAYAIITGHEALIFDMLFRRQQCVVIFDFERDVLHPLRGVVVAIHLCLRR